MKFIRNTRALVVLALLVAGCAALGAAFSEPLALRDAEVAARKLSRSVERRVALLNTYVDRALAQSPYEWMNLNGLPRDMVVYRYCDDTLQSWAGQFPLFNDDLSSRVVFQNLTTQRSSIVSPLSAVTDSVTYMNLGPKWYLVYYKEADDCHVIGGLEVLSDQSDVPFRGVNMNLRIPPKYSVSPLENDEGIPVFLDGRPLFKLAQDSLSVQQSADPLLLLLAMIFFLSGGLVFLTAHRTVKRGAAFIAFILALTALAYLWGRSAQSYIILFSPIIYAGGDVLYSLGAVVIFNLAILLVSAAFFLVRDDLAGRIGTRASAYALTACVIVAVTLIIVYTYDALSSIISNSGICLELYKLTELSWFSAVVYLSFLSMLMGIPLLLQLIRPAVRTLSGKDLDSFSRAGRVLFSVVISGYLLATAGFHGLRSEGNRLEVVANRLAIDRDITLEVRLKRAEVQIASDMIISTLSVFENTSATILNRITDLYLGRVNQEYSVSVTVLNKGNATLQAEEFFASKLAGGVPISDNSHFLYVNNGTGHSYYAGLFFYQVNGQGPSRVLVTVDGRYSRDGSGYGDILGVAPPGSVSVPDKYSYARYDGRYLQYSKGSYPYVTRMDDNLAHPCYEEEVGHMRMDGYIHFVTKISDNECVILSRQTLSVLDILIAFMVIGLFLYVFLSVFTAGFRPSEQTFRKNYYKTRIGVVLLVSLVLTLVAMSLVSVLFVYSRNESNKHTLMTDKINSIMSLVEPGARQLNGPKDLVAPEFRSLIESTAVSTHSEITLFSTKGSMLFSTVPGLYERMLLNTRMDGEAYNGIMLQHKSYLIHRERIGRRRFYNVYSPIMGADGSIVGILNAPYTDAGFGFEEDAVSHSVAVLAVFLFLLLLSRFMTNSVLGRLFRPLGVLGNKINDTNLDSLELIEYNRDDEVKSLVQAYNRMVTELSENSRKLAQAERDKAWSGMARQVAHEIKNPLTPMKLQLQRVIRLKQKGDPQWQERFDEASKVLLDHIDILTETANEFSTFAKLYSEDPTDINLDRLLQEEISMFNNREDIEFQYLGLADAHISGPKPQLTRVFVNLLSNAVQALDEKGGGHIILQLRNASEEGFYEIVVEDDGPGVSAENQEKLFTPNFTTKSSGSGLGLSISRSVLERCGASISYSRSFTLGGACFTVKYPK